MKTGFDHVKFYYTLKQFEYKVFTDQIYCPALKPLFKFLFLVKGFEIFTCSHF